MSSGYDDVRASLERMYLLSRGARFEVTPLTGGVSSRILLIEAEGQRICFKQAMAKLNVAADWYAPVERNRAEVAWINVANSILPGISPKVLAEDSAMHAFAMAYLPLEDYSVWKSALRCGRASSDTARAAGHALAALHGATAGDADLAKRFDNAEQFHALRIEPFILATAQMHPLLAERLETLAADIGSARMTLIHGDFSPKNILVGGPHGLIVLDAECATYGDPAFDVGFCLTHLMLKQVAHRENQQVFEAFRCFLDGYQSGVAWESWSGFEQRLLRMLPALILARIDGKSPVDYLDNTTRNIVRAFGVGAISEPADSIIGLEQAWGKVFE